MENFDELLNFEIVEIVFVFLRTLGRARACSSFIFADPRDNSVRSNTKHQERITTCGLRCRLQSRDSNWKGTLVYYLYFFSKSETMVRSTMET